MPTIRTRLAACAPAALLGLAVGAPLQPAAADPISFTDQAGRAVTLAALVDRVVAIPIPSPPVIGATVGRVDSLIAMHPRARDSARIGMMTTFHPELLDVPTDIIVGSGFDPNVEEILKYDPDIVFQWASQDLSVLESAGLQPVALNTGSHEQLEGMMRIFGLTHGETGRAEQIIGWHQDVHGMLHEMSADIPAEDRPQVLYFYRFHMGDIWQTRGGSIESEYRNWFLNMVGADNVAMGEAGTLDFTPEQAVAWAPDIILLNAYERADVTGADLTPADVYADPYLSQTPAARNHRVYKMPVGAVWWDSGNQESPLMWMWIAMLAHPDRFDIDLRSEIGEAFRFLYGYELSEDEIDAILHMEMHAGAAHYDQFARAD